MATIDYEELSSNMNKYKILDVRNKDEVEENGKIPGSFNIPFPEFEDAFDLEEENFSSNFGFEKPPQQAPIVTHCLKGGRAMKAYHILEGKGYINAKCYPGSFEDWESRGGKIVKDNKN